MTEQRNELIDMLTTGAEMLKIGLLVPPDVLIKAAKRIGELEAARASQPAPEVKIRVNEYNRIFLQIGVQSFMLDFEPGDEPGSSAQDQAAWMAEQLNTAMYAITPCVKMEISAPTVQERTIRTHRERDQAAAIEQQREQAGDL